MATRNEDYARGQGGIGRSTGANGETDVAHIRADIQETRERMSHTVEDIGERLNPDRLKNQMRDNLREATIGKAGHMARAAADRVDDTRHSIMDTIRDNPIPAAMVGIGLGWLLVNGRRHEEEYMPGDRWREDYGEMGSYRSLENSYDRSYETSASGDVIFEPEFELESGDGRMQHAKDRVTEIAHDARDTISDFADRAQERIAGTRSRARKKASDLRHVAGRRSHRVEDRFEHVMQESPLAVGAAAAALGLAIGLAAPSTRRESEVIGPVRDRMLDRAKHATQEATHKVRDVASQVKHEAQETAREGLGLT